MSSDCGPESGDDNFASVTDTEASNNVDSEESETESDITFVTVRPFRNAALIKKRIGFDIEERYKNGDLNRYVTTTDDESSQCEYENVFIGNTQFRIPKTSIPLPELLSKGEVNIEDIIEKDFVFPKRKSSFFSNIIKSRRIALRERLAQKAKLNVQNRARRQSHLQFGLKNDSSEKIKMSKNGKVENIEWRSSSNESLQREKKDEPEKMFCSSISDIFVQRPKKKIEIRMPDINASYREPDEKPKKNHETNQKPKQKTNLKCANKIEKIIKVKSGHEPPKYIKKPPKKIIKSDKECGNKLTKLREPSKSKPSITYARPQPLNRIKKTEFPLSKTIKNKKNIVKKKKNKTPIVKKETAKNQHHNIAATKSCKQNIPEKKPPIVSDFFGLPEKKTLKKRRRRRRIRRRPRTQSGILSGWERIFGRSPRKPPARAPEWEKLYTTNYKGPKDILNQPKKWKKWDKLYKPKPPPKEKLVITPGKRILLLKNVPVEKFIPNNKYKIPKRVKNIIPSSLSKRANREPATKHCSFACDIKNLPNKIQKTNVEETDRSNESSEAYEIEHQPREREEETKLNKTIHNFVPKSILMKEASLPSAVVNNRSKQLLRRMSFSSVDADENAELPNFNNQINFNNNNNNYNNYNENFDQETLLKNSSNDFQFLRERLMTAAKKRIRFKLDENSVNNNEMRENDRSEDSDDEMEIIEKHPHKKHKQFPSKVEPEININNQRHYQHSLLHIFNNAKNKNNTYNRFKDSEDQNNNPNHYQSNSENEMEIEENHQELVRSNFEYETHDVDVAEKYATNLASPNEADEENNSDSSSDDDYINYTCPANSAANSDNSTDDSDSNESYYDSNNENSEDSDTNDSDEKYSNNVVDFNNNESNDEFENESVHFDEEATFNNYEGTDNNFESFQKYCDFEEKTHFSSFETNNYEYSQLEENLVQNTSYDIQNEYDSDKEDDEENDGTEVSINYSNYDDQNENAENLENYSNTETCAIEIVSTYEDSSNDDDTTTNIVENITIDTDLSEKNEANEIDQHKSGLEIAKKNLTDTLVESIKSAICTSKVAELFQKFQIENNALTVTEENDNQNKDDATSYDEDSFASDCSGSIIRCQLYNEFPFNVHFEEEKETGIKVRFRRRYRKSYSFSKERMREIDRHNHLLLTKILKQKPTYSAEKMMKKQSRLLERKPSSASITRNRMQNRIDYENRILRRKLEAIASRPRQF